MAKKLKLILAAVVAVLSLGACCMFSFSSANAEDRDDVIHLQVSPTKQSISLTPGSSYVGSFTVHNAGTGVFDYSVYATPFSVTNEEYLPDYVSTTNYTQIADWITFDQKTEKGTLQPGETVDVVYTVNVPKDAPAGGQYAALMAQTDSGNDENATINVVHRVGMILYAAVPGETRSSGEIVKNSVNTFYFNPPLTVSSLVKNTGNVEQTATYTVKIYPLFSNEAVYNNEEQPDSKDIMPDTSRFNAITWEGAPSIGIFRVTQIIDFAGQEENREVTKLVLICPLWLLFVIFALLFFIIFWLISRARDRKRELATATGVRSQSSRSERSHKEAGEKTRKEAKEEAHRGAKEETHKETSTKVEKEKK